MIGKSKIDVYICDCKNEFLDQLDFVVKEWCDYKTDFLVMARCCPDLREAELGKVIDPNDFNPYMYTHINIWKQTTWVDGDKKRVTKKAKSLLGIGIWEVN